MEVVIDGVKKKVLDFRDIEGYRQVKYMSGYDIPFWHCNCGEFGTHCCTPNFCKHTAKIFDKER